MLMQTLWYKPMHMILELLSSKTFHLDRFSLLSLVWSTFLPFGGRSVYSFPEQWHGRLFLSSCRPSFGVGVSGIKRPPSLNTMVFPTNTNTIPGSSASSLLNPNFFPSPLDFACQGTIQESIFSIFSKVLFTSFKKFLFMSLNVFHGISSMKHVKVVKLLLVLAESVIFSYLYDSEVSTYALCSKCKWNIWFPSRRWHSLKDKRHEINWKTPACFSESILKKSVNERMATSTVLHIHWRCEFFFSSCACG